MASNIPHTAFGIFFYSIIIWLKDNEQLCLVPIFHKMQNRSLVHWWSGELYSSRKHKEINVFQNRTNYKKQQKRRNPYLGIV